MRIQFLGFKNGGGVNCMTLSNFGYLRIAALVVNIYHKRLAFFLFFFDVSKFRILTYNKSVRWGEGS